MAEFDRKKRDEELDRFWEIDDLIPRRQAPRYAADTEAVEITVAPPTNIPSKRKPYGMQSIPPAEVKRDAPKPHFIPPHTADELSRRPAPELEYVPENALIRSVRIYPVRSDRLYHEDFVRNATRLAGVVGIECARVPFFSYVPQYTQMSRPQLAWYLWWRECFRHGRALDTDYSYVLLYVFELINLSSPENAAATQALMLRVWQSYRKTFRQLDTHLPDWICDLSLLYRLPPPAFDTSSARTEIMSHCTLKEFYLPTGSADTYVDALLTFSSNYDYRKSKFYCEGREPLFDRAIFGAIRTLIESTGEEGKLFSSAGMDDSKLCRDSFGGALCATRIARRIEVDFCSFSRAHELRYLITDAVKYTENKLRAHFGIRSRLSIYSLPDAIRELLDGYLSAVIPARVRQSEKKIDTPAEYEILYDLPKKDFSLADAARIEALSWETTERLVEAFEEETVTEIPAVPKPEPPKQSEATEKDNPWTPYLPFLRAVYTQNTTAQRETAARAKKFPEVLADEINTLAADLLGDVLIEEDGTSFAVIEDYRDVAEALLRNDGKEI